MFGIYRGNGDAETDITTKSDQEPAIELLLKETIEARPKGMTIPEEAPKKWGPGATAGGNGIVEREAQETEGQTRAILLNLCERLGRNLDARERIVAFIPEFERIC